MFRHEHAAHREGFNLVIGVDEAGRGPLAGPVVASAVAVKDQNFCTLINDSKRLTTRQREEAFQEITQKTYFGIGIISEAVIDQVNILEATFLAMSFAVNQLVDKISQQQRSAQDFNNQVFLLVDGPRFKSDLPYAFKPIVRGDQIVFSIMCASIVAKVFRDRILNIYGLVFPEYGFTHHKGYATPITRLNPSRQNQE